MNRSMTPERSREPNRSDRLLLHVGWTIWDNVSQLLFASMLLLIAAYPALFLATGTSWSLAWPVLMLSAGPVWAGVVAASGRLLDDDAISNRMLLDLIRVHAWQGLRISVVPTIAGTVMLGSLHLLDRNPDAVWLAFPLLLDLGVAIVVSTSLVTIFTLSGEHDATAADLWLASATMTISRPIPVLGTLTLFGLVAWMAAVFGPVALIAVAPLAVLCAAVVRDGLPDPAE